MIADFPLIRLELIIVIVSNKPYMINKLLTMVPELSTFKRLLIFLGAMLGATVKAIITIGIEMVNVQLNLLIDEKQINIKGLKLTKPILPYLGKFNVLISKTSKYHFLYELLTIHRQ